MRDLGLHFVAKSNYFSNTQTSHTRPIIDGVRSSVAYSSIHLFAVVFGTAIPTSFYIFVFHVSIFWHNSTLKEDTVFASFFQNLENKSVIITAISTCHKRRYRAWGGGLNTIIVEGGGLSLSKRS